MEYEGCYVYEPSNKGYRPAKRRRIGPHGLQASWKLRQKVYTELWSERQAQFDKVLSDLNEATITSVADFIAEAPTRDQQSKLPCGILITGPNIASHGTLFDQLSTSLSGTTRTAFVNLTSGQAPNVKTLLKHIVSKGTSSHVTVEDNEDDELLEVSKKGPRLLDYDLQILQNTVKERRLNQVVIAFQDCEAFDGSLLSDTIELLNSWRERIPFTLLFGVATSIENLQAKLTRKAIRCIAGQRFDVVQAESALEQIFDILRDETNSLWIGPSVASSLLSRQRDHVQSSQSFLDSVQYMYMAHFYANALSLFLTRSLDPGSVPKDHYEAVRTLPSFKSYIQELLDQGEASLVRSLLESDKTLHENIGSEIIIGQRALANIVNATEIVSRLQNCLSPGKQTLLSDLFVQACGGELRGSISERTFMLLMRKANSEALQRILMTLKPIVQGELARTIEALDSELAKLLGSRDEGATPLRSEEDIHNSTLRTTVIAKKVELSKQKSTLTKADAAYSGILNRFVEALDDHFETALINPRDLTYNEIFIYDLKSPNRDVFTPKPRFAVERALSSPHDYLNCACCVPDADSNDESTLAATQPATAILYQLYLESGAIINASDLRSAFVALLDEEVQDESQVAALFQRALAELRYLGLVKGTKKKVDHVMKVSWRGL